MTYKIFTLFIINKLIDIWDKKKINNYISYNLNSEYSEFELKNYFCFYICTNALNLLIL